ncbi:MAG TPA: DUF2807 domain-containing protein [Allosphingosinicella sp.]|nr:DUF2807 domain-containing protein [Allosphingosinicella sp.]
MKAQPLLTAASLALFAAAPAAAQVSVPVGPFRSIELDGGGRALVRYAPVQKVRILQGNARISSIRVSDRPGSIGRNGNGARLVIRTCPNRCPMGYRFELMIETPNLDGLGVVGDGEIEVAPGFPREDSLAVGVKGNGRIDAREVTAGRVAAGVSGDGEISLGPADALVAGVSGKGRILYRGQPRLTSSVAGGGRIEQAD